MPTDLFVKALADTARKLAHCQPDIRGLIQQLPESDAELDAVFAELVSERDSAPFSRIWMAAHAAEREIDARHLVDGGAIFEGIDILITTAQRCTGDVCGSLIAAVKHDRMGSERDLSALILAADWWKSNRDAPLPAELIILARKLVRSGVGSAIAAPLLRMALAEVTRDEALGQLVGARGGFEGIDAKEATADWLAMAHTKDPLSIIPETRPERVLSGYTVRRAAPKIGRNDPCHCGSGKKYKKCCAAADAERIADSSDIEGVTLSEIEAAPEGFVTGEQIWSMRSYEVYRLDPDKVPRQLLPNVLDRLADFSEFDRICQIVETLTEIDEEMRYWLGQIAWKAGKHHRIEIVRRLLELVPELENDLSLETRIQIAEDPCALLDMLESNARKCIEAEEPDVDEANAAHGMLVSRYPALGVLLGRAAVATANSFNCDALIDSIGEVRDELGLTPFDAAEDIADHAFEREQAREKEEERSEEQRKLEGNRQEMNRLRRDTEKLKTELEKREREAESQAREAKNADQQMPAAQPAPESKPDVEESKEVKDLRAKLSATREELKLRHSERNDLRRDLRSARKTIDKLKDETPAASDKHAKADSDAEEERSLADLPANLNWPVRVPVFPKGWASECGTKLTVEAVRAAMILAGRLAAGESSAIAGVRPLKLRPHLYRQKVAGVYRLFFELTEEELRIVDLIHRRDLEKWLKTHR